VSKVTPAPISKAALAVKERWLDAPPPPTECVLVDQYAIGDASAPKRGCSRFWELFYGVAIANDVSSRPGTTSTLLGPTGHYERLSFWTHVGGGLIFVIYSIVRQFVATNRSSVEGVLTTAAGFTAAGVFFTSSFYHCTAPDPHWAAVTRVLDYAAIYIGITVTTTADIAVATRGFLNVPAQTIADLPASAVILIVFFVWRRSRLPGESTWTKHEITSRSKDGCLLGRGLFSYGHRDLAHIQMRQSTSLLLFGSYFMVVPAAMDVLGHGVARVVLALQVSAFVTVALGMAIDRVFEFPDGNLVEGSMTCLACPNTCGAVLNSHALWHLVAMVSAGLTVASREYALAYS
jgi:predicted membrane channel-forming protein YqfA (hemolysin III family)